MKLGVVSGEVFPRDLGSRPRVACSALFARLNFGPSCLRQDQWPQGFLVVREVTAKMA